MSYVLLLNYKHLSPDYKETRCSISQPHFRNLALYLKRCLKKGSQNKPAEGESAYLAQRRQNRLFLFFPVFSFLSISSHLEESVWDTHCPRVNLSSLKVAVFIQSLHAVAWYLHHLRCRLFHSLHLCILWNCSFRTISLEEIKLLARLRTGCKDLKSTVACLKTLSGPQKDLAIR